MATQTAGDTHTHEPYSHRGHTFRCRCGATAPTGAGPWAHDGTRACSICAAPTAEVGDEPLCQWHRSTAPERTAESR